MKIFFKLQSGLLTKLETDRQKIWAYNKTARNCAHLKTRKAAQKIQKSEFKTLATVATSACLIKMILKF